MEPYLHGYDTEEQHRLHSQNDVLSPLIYRNIDLSNRSQILEIGCGSGAQMLHVLKTFPDAHITGIDHSMLQLESCLNYLKASKIGLERFKLIHADGTHLPMPDQAFDTILFVWVLEHISNPIPILFEAFRTLQKKGVMYFTEVYNRSFQHYPEKPEVSNFWNRMMVFQQNLSGNGNIGIQLANLLSSLPVSKLETWAVPVFYDRSQPDAKNQMFNYWTELMHSAALQMIKNNCLSLVEWQKVAYAMDELINDPDSVFFYNWIQAKVIR